MLLLLLLFRRRHHLVITVIVVAVRNCNNSRGQTVIATRSFFSGPRTNLLDDDSIVTFQFNHPKKRKIQWMDAFRIDNRAENSTP